MSSGATWRGKQTSLEGGLSVDHQIPSGLRREWSPARIARISLVKGSVREKPSLVVLGGRVSKEPSKGPIEEDHPL